jgi:hypothetical protein
MFIDADLLPPMVATHPPPAVGSAPIEHPDHLSISLDLTDETAVTECFEYVSFPA